MKYLIDASALYSVIESGSLPLVSDIAVLVLTKYEVGNVIWKRNRKKEIKDLTKVTNAFADFFTSVITVDVDFDSVEELAIKKDISFYDAAYIFAAEHYDIMLITEDKEILRKSEKAINTEGALKRWESR